MHKVHITGMKLDDYLSREKLTDEAFGSLIGRNQSTVYRLRKGVTKPDWDTVARIIAATGGAVSADDFLQAEQSQPDTAA